MTSSSRIVRRIARAVVAAPSLRRFAESAESLRRNIRLLLDFLCAKAKAFEGIKANDETIDLFFKQLKRIVIRGAWLLVLALSVNLLSFPPVVGQTVMLLLGI